MITLDELNKIGIKRNSSLFIDYLKQVIMPYEGDNLSLSIEEKEKLIKKHIEVIKSYIVVCRELLEDSEWDVNIQRLKIINDKLCFTFRVIFKIPDGEIKSTTSDIKEDMKGLHIVHEVRVYSDLYKPNNNEVFIDFMGFRNKFSLKHFFNGYVHSHLPSKRVLSEELILEISDDLDFEIENNSLLKDFLRGFTTTSNFCTGTSSLGSGIEILKDKLKDFILLHSLENTDNLLSEIQNQIRVIIFQHEIMAYTESTNSAPYIRMQSIKEIGANKKIPYISEVLVKILQSFNPASLVNSLVNSLFNDSVFITKISKYYESGKSRFTVTCYDSIFEEILNHCDINLFKNFLFRKIPNTRCWEEISVLNIPSFTKEIPYADSFDEKVYFNGEILNTTLYHNNENFENITFSPSYVTKNAFPIIKNILIQMVENKLNLLIKEKIQNGNDNSNNSNRIN